MAKQAADDKRVAEVDRANARKAQDDAQKARDDAVARAASLKGELAKAETAGKEVASSRDAALAAVKKLESTQAQLTEKQAQLGEKLAAAERARDAAQKSLAAAQETIKAQPDPKILETARREFEVARKEAQLSVKEMTVSLRERAAEAKEKGLKADQLAAELKTLEGRLKAAQDETRKLRAELEKSPTKTSAASDRPKAEARSRPSKVVRQRAKPIPTPLECRQPIIHRIELRPQIWLPSKRAAVNLRYLAAVGPPTGHRCVAKNAAKTGSF